MTLFMLGAFLVVAAVVLFVLQPVLSGLEAPSVGVDDEITEAESRKRMSLLALRDVEYDFATGKLDEHDYRTLRAELAREALANLSAEAEAEAGGGAAPTSDAGVPVAGSGDDVEREIARYRAALRTGTLCDGCGGANPPEARFCATCGSPLGSEAGEPAEAGAP